MARSVWKVVVIIAVAIGMLTSCSWIDGLFGRVVELANLDISDAAALFVTKVEETAEGAARLFKLTVNGVVARVEAITESGRSLDDLEPQSVMVLNDDYVIMIYRFLRGHDVPAVLVRRSDGAVFSLDEVGVPVARPDFNEGDDPYMELVEPQSDAEGTVYFIVAPSFDNGTEPHSVYALDLSDPENLVATRITPETDSVLGFLVTPEGHVAYNYGDGSSNRIRTAGGGIYNLPDAGWMPLWRNGDGEISFQDTGSLDPSQIYTAHIDSGGNVTVDSVSAANFTNRWFQSISTYLLRLADRAYLVDTQNGHIAEVENPTDSPRGVDLAEIETIDVAAASDDYYYLAGADASNNPLLLRVNPLTDEVTTLLPSDGISYEVIDMVVSSEGEITMNALRFSDGVKVIGRIDAAGTLFILDEALNSSVTSLERLQ